MNPVQHAHLVVKQARAFFDSWFDRFPTLDVFLQALESRSLKEFGISWDVCKIEKWFGGTADVEQVDKIGNKIGNLISRVIKNPPAREVRSTVGKYYSSWVWNLSKELNSVLL